MSKQKWFWSDIGPITQKICHIIHFFAVTKSYCKFTQFLFYLTYLSCDLYIYLVTWICPTKFSDVGFCPTKFKLCPTKIKSDQTNVLSSQIFICSPELQSYAVWSVRVCDISEQNLVPSISMLSNNNHDFYKKMMIIIR
jgi:hypothetical protein